MTFEEWCASQTFGKALTLVDLHNLWEHFEQQLAELEADNLFRNTDLKLAHDRIAKLEDLLETAEAHIKPGPDWDNYTSRRAVLREGESGHQQWEAGVKQSLLLLAATLQADTWKKDGKPITKEQMIDSVASTLRGIAKGAALREGEKG